MDRSAWGGWPSGPEEKLLELHEGGALARSRLITALMQEPR
jgi:hypothetical protein